MTTEMPTREELDAHFDQFGRDVDYFNSISRQARQDYPDQYVAVYKGQVAATHKKLKKLLAVLKDNDIPANHAVIRYFASKPKPRIL